MNFNILNNFQKKIYIGIFDLVYFLLFFKKNFFRKKNFFLSTIHDIWNTFQKNIYIGIFDLVYFLLFFKKKLFSKIKFFFVYDSLHLEHFSKKYLYRDF